MLDLDQFVSVEAAVEAIQRPRGFDDVAKPVLEWMAAPGRAGLTYLTLFFGSAVTRARGLHEGIAREARAGNPHAVFPLIRQFAETVALVLYVVDHPDYVLALTARPRDRPNSAPARKSIQAIIHQIEKKHAPQFGMVYAELCEIAHFGSVGMWASYRVDDEDERAVSWTSYPRWRDDRQAFIACALMLELAAAMEDALRQLGDVARRSVR